MANLCNFLMQIKGKKENMEKFCEALEQKTSEAWIGRGARIYVEYEDNLANISGHCKWSVVSALIDNAKSMESQRLNNGKGEWHWDEEMSSVKKFITLFEACEMFNINMEVFSWESGCCFSEHLKYENGNTTEECIDYSEKYNVETEEWDEIGGFSPDFNLLSVA